MEKLSMESADLIGKNIDAIGELFPEVIVETSEGSGDEQKLKRAIDFDKLRLLLDRDVVPEGREVYDFTWVGKNAAIREAHTKTRKTLRPCPEESRDWDTTQNLYIEGDNLEVLKILRESYFHKVKMIYIDPPYNTGSDYFVYPDNHTMSEEEYKEKSGSFNDGGEKVFKENQNTNPKFHSDWCSMMYSRLLLARNLLTDDGVILISIDDNERTNLDTICRQIFGEDNLVADLIWDLGTGTTAGHFARGHEYLLCYAKNKEKLLNFKNYNDGERIVHGALKKISYKNPAVEITFPTGFEFE